MSQSGAALSSTPSPKRAPQNERGPGASPLIALVGRPNSGKSSLFNALTGGDAHVGNFPGITVEILESSLKLPSGDAAQIADLPGLYSIEAVVDSETDEGVARRFVDDATSSGRPLVLAQIIDATQLALGLRLTRELVRRPVRLVVVATQRDVLESQGRTLDAAQLAQTLGVPVVLVSARDPKSRDVVLEAIEARLADLAPSAPVSPTWNADALARACVSDRAAATPDEHRRRDFTARADAILLHPAIGPILFLGLMAALFAAVFLVADPATALMDAMIQLGRAAITRTIGEGLVASFLADGVLGGAGTVLAFMPQIVILTLAMELLEATGYLARGAFLLDRLLRLLGLSGRSFLPLLMGHACAIPAIAATRIIRDPRERLTAILVIPLMTCSARIPTYALVLSTFFGGRGVWFRAMLFVGLYFSGVLAGLVASLLLRRSATKGKSLPLVLEMPQYRAPQLGVIARKGWQAATRFMRDVGTMILAVSAVLWVLLTVPLPGKHAVAAAPTNGAAAAIDVPHAEPPVEVEDTSAIDRSIAAAIGKALEPITKPCGFDWRINVGLIGSFGAREVMVGTMGVIFGIEDAGDDPAPLSRRIREAKSSSGAPAYSTATGLALLAFFVFACQCMSTVAAIRRETKTLRWPAFVLAYTYVVAYVAALVVFQVSRIFFGA